MSTVLDQYGNIASRRFARSVNSDPFRGMVFGRRDESITRSIPAGDRRALGALSRRVVFNSPIPREVIRQKASYAVGGPGAWRPEYQGDDASAGEAATRWLENEFFPCVSFASGGCTWWDLLETISKAVDRDGEAFCLLSRDPDTSTPAIILIPSYQVRSDITPQEIVQGGEFDGARLIDGIGYDIHDRAIFYRVYGPDDSREWEDVPAASIVHLFEREFPEQRRGYPVFSAVLGDILQGIESKELEILRQLVVSNIMLLNKGGGPPRPTDGGFEEIVNTATNESVTREKIAPGIWYLNSGQEIEAVTHTTPGDIWSSFQDRLQKESIVCAGWSETLLGYSTGQGTAERGAVVRARLAVKSRQKTLRRGAIQFCNWSLAVGNGPATADFQWNFTVPARLTVDDGREDRSLLERVKSGAMAESDYLATHGTSTREHYLKKARDMETAREIAEAFDGIETADLMVRKEAPMPTGTPEPEITLPDD